MKSFIIPSLIIILFFFASCKLNNEEDEPIVIDFDQIPVATLITNSRALITWETLDSLGGVFHYGVNKYMLTNSIEFEASPNIQNITLSNLLLDTEYFYTLSFNFEENVVETDTLTITTKNIEYNISSDLESYQREIIKYLTGEQSIGDSVLLTDRACLENRTHAANYLEKELSSLGVIVRRQNYSNIIFNGLHGSNVFCVVPATINTDDHIVFGAHYDSVTDSPGANDNASGVALVLAVTNELLKMQTRTKHVIIVFFDNEEDGLIGSFVFADSLNKSGTKIHSAHTVDQVAWDEDGDRAIELELPTPALEFLYEAVNAEIIQLPIYVTNVGSTDHSSFRNIQIPAIGITEEYFNGDTTPHIHSNRDTYDTVNFDYLKNTTQFVYFALKTLLNQ